jgi:hypothetical protein
MAGYLNLEDVSVEFHYWILHVWADARKLIKSEQAENAIYYEFLEKVVNRLLEYDRPRTGALQLPTDAEIEDIYAEESHLPSAVLYPALKGQSVVPRSTNALTTVCRRTGTL